MITETDLAKTRFFTTDGTDIWKVRLVRTVKEVELANCESGDIGILRLDGNQNKRFFEGDDPAERFFPVTMPKIKAIHPKRKYTRRKTINKGRVPKADAGRVPCRKGTSSYMGVSINNKATKKKFRAQVSRGGKYKYLGSFVIEEEAAAAIQEFLGNHEEATRLRVLARQKSLGHVIDVTGMTAWMCNNCGVGYDKKPEACSKCGRNSFTRSRPEKA